MATKDMELTTEEKQVLELAMQFYIRLGLGQFSELYTRLNLIHGTRLTDEQKDKLRQLAEEMEEVCAENQPWKLTDDETSLYTLVGYLLEQKIAGNKPKNTKWAQDLIEKRKQSGEKIQ